jgi:hypothetical protein
LVAARRRAGFADFRLCHFVQRRSSITSTAGTNCPLQVMMVPNYAVRRSEVAKQIGLGRKVVEEKKAKRSRVKKVRATSSEASPA